jgi:hypothetical protein
VADAGSTVTSGSRTSAETNVGGAARRAVPEVDALFEEYVAWRIAFAPGDDGTRCSRRSAIETRPTTRDREDASAFAAAVPPDHFEQPLGCGSSIRKPVVGVPPGTTYVVTRTPSPVSSFLTRNVLAAIS